ncbi:hypothetical protein BDY21DRAFT_279883 [Lineolata rhizophorae]|uniref:Cupin type-2 domain-containing protein n=1 Tax=Lineolata rhizophorae TaxID=578093 RepID=A0A6A6P9S2_9PEZI|nr:hypothetical protein BDY21DRAFT_279883 [Lineolata rhizophorae]
MAHVGKLPQVHRYITTHDANGKAIFSNAVPEENTMKPVGEMGFALGYTTKTFPVQLGDDADIETYKPFLADAPGLTVSGGTVLRHVDFPPDTTCSMHRTVSLDYGVVLEGELELILDSGETKLMKRGDVAVQRGTMHAWRNPHKTEWARMMFVLQPCEQVLIDGKPLKEDFMTKIDGLKASE